MISDEDAKGLGKELSSQHPLTVFGMAKASTKIGAGFKITSYAVTAVRADGCELRVTLCRGDLCEMKKSFYKFPTPLGSPKDLPDTIRQIRTNVCSPNLFWLVTDPLALVILVVCSLLAYGTYIGVESMTDAFLGAPKVERTISAVFGSPQTFSYLVCGSFWFSVAAHGLEASIAVYYSITSLKIGVLPTTLWGIMIFLVGYPVFSRLQQLVSIEHGHAKSK